VADILKSPPVVDSDVILSDAAEIQINDPALGYYVKSLLGDSLGGNFGTFLREISTIDNVGPFHIGAVDVRDGVLNIAASINLPTVTAENMLLSLRRSFRESRDRQIIAGAANRYMAGHTGIQPTSIADLSPMYLKIEDELFSKHYTIQNLEEERFPSATDQPGHISVGCCFRTDEKEYCVRSDGGKEYILDQRVLNKKFSEDDIKPIAQEIPFQFFRSEEYDASTDVKFIRYITPPVTDNDLQYRLLTSDERGLDVDALRKGRFRLAGYIDSRLVVATDHDTLMHVLSRSITSTIEEEEAVDIKMSKVVLRGDPRFIISQGELYPEKGINDFFSEYLLDFVQYNGVVGVVLPANDSRALIVRMTLKL
jgi:hypothetical protein